MAVLGSQLVEFVAVILPGTTAPIRFGFLIHWLMPAALLLQADLLLLPHPVCKAWPGALQRPSASGRSGAGLPQQRRIPSSCQRSGGPAEGSGELSASAAAPQTCSPSPGQGGGEEPEHGNQLVPGAELSRAMVFHEHICAARLVI